MQLMRKVTGELAINASTFHRSATVVDFVVCLDWGADHGHEFGPLQMLLHIDVALPI